ADGEYTAVVDRFEDDLAVLLLEREGEGETVDDILLPKTELPESGRHQDAVLYVSVEDGEVRDATYKAGETDQRAERAQSRFDRLSQRPSESETEADTDPER
ncbi:DUF3006 domain-containing protein, partial [Halococcus salifodinae]